MAISLKNYANRPNTIYSEFVCDLISDISLLPTTTTKGQGDYSSFGSCPMGSCCYCFEDGNVYGLSSFGWIIM